MRQAADRLWTTMLAGLELNREGLAAALCCALLSSAGGPSFAPLGPGAVAAAWLMGRPGLWELGGGLLGALIAGRWAGLLQLTMLTGLRLLSHGSRMRSRSRDKLILTLCSGLLCAPFFYISSPSAAMLGLGQVSLSALFAAVFSRAGRGIKRGAMGRGLGEQDVTAVILALGAACAALAPLGYGGVSLGGILACAAALCCAGAMGIYAVAAAAVTGAGVAIGGGEMAFVGAIAIGALGASALREGGRGGQAAGFLALTALCAWHTGCWPGAVIEAGAAAAGYLLLPRRHILMLGRCLRFGRSDAEERLGALKGRVQDAAVVLDRVSALFEQCPESEAELFAGKQLRCMSEAISSISQPRRPHERRFGLDYGMASCPRPGSRQAGDSMSIRELNWGKLVLLSDGMGSGPPARRESSTAISLIGDLLSVGVNELDALDCANRLLMYKGEREMYATLDAVTFDYASGSARFLKLGAPPSYVLRRDKVIELCAETLPIGIVAAASPAREELTLEKGDMVFMLTDGVTDALEGELIERIGAAAGKGPKAAAEALLRAAAGRGAMDDMSVIAMEVC